MKRRFFKTACVMGNPWDVAYAALFLNYDDAPHTTDPRSSSMTALSRVLPRRASNAVSSRGQLAFFGSSPYLAHISLTIAVSLPPAIKPMTAEDTCPPLKCASMI
jgi:hypothetical protein